MLATLVPAIVYVVIVLILVYFYPLNKKRLQEMTDNLKAKREGK